MGSVESDERYTPEYVLDVTRAFGGGRIALDPCTTPYNRTRADTYLFEGGTDADWGVLARMHRPGPRVTWCNPPFSNGNLKRWVHKCVVEAAKHPALDIVTLLPSDFGTVAGQLALSSCDALCYVRGRIPFIGPDEKPLPAGAKTATVLVYWGDRAKTFKRLFEKLGAVVVIIR